MQIPAQNGLISCVRHLGLSHDLIVIRSNGFSLKWPVYQHYSIRSSQGQQLVNTCWPNVPKIFFGLQGCQISYIMVSQCLELQICWFDAQWCVKVMFSSKYLHTAIMAKKGHFSLTIFFQKSILVSKIIETSFDFFRNVSSTFLKVLHFSRKFLDRNQWS